ncbi:MAG: C-terminal binding protein [Clostridiales Family XIII bacterium]|jgi:D-3-phosphoglycerate dehydrogenase|nr:C-terminal binding protein [Clostridiales Family XIII bacterium]
MKFVLTDVVGSTAKNEQILKMLPDGAEVACVYQDPDDTASFLKEIESADAIINVYAKFGKEEIDHLKACKVISFRSTAFSSVDIDYAAEKGIAVCNVNEYCTQEVSDHAIMFMLALQKGLMYHEKSIQKDKEWKWNAAPGVRRIEGQTLGIFGLGKIGQAVARKAQALGMKVIAYDPYLPQSVAADMGVELTLTDIDWVLANSDVITIHMNLTSENSAFFDLSKFEKMIKNPFIINVARGPMIDEEDLAKALDLGLVRGAGLDVLESENPGLTKCPLLGRPNVILTAHGAFFSHESVAALGRVAAENAIACLEGRYKDAGRVVNGVGL